MTNQLDFFVGGGGEAYGQPQNLLLRYANRHGLIAGATGTGKTVSLQILAESFSDAGVPVFLADVKGDLSGLCKAGTPDFKLHDAFLARAEKIGFTDYGYQQFPTLFWDVFGKKGHPIRTTIADMGPLLLSRLLDLTEAQEGILNIAFRLAEEEELPLIDLRDLQAMLVWLGENSEQYALRYGNITTASVGSIQRRLIVLENQGANQFFGQPALKLEDMISTNRDGKGLINILAADKLMESPRLYATFLLWLLSELFEKLPEVGDPEKPKFVFFFDEAHLLFDDAPDALINKVEQVARLIRSKGVGVYFITQNPADIPDDILGQLGNRIQHALRAYTPRDQKALRAAADTFRPNPSFDTENAIQEVGVGEALVSLLEDKAVPAMVQRTLIRPPSTQLGPISDEERALQLKNSPIAGLYEAAQDARSAFEILNERAEAEADAQERAEQRREAEFSSARRYEMGDDDTPPARKSSGRSTRRSSRSDSPGAAMAKSVLRSAGSMAGRQLMRQLMRGIFRR